MAAYETAAPMTLRQFQAKYGIKGLSLLIGEFINRAPEFSGDKELAKAIGSALGDLEVMLFNEPEFSKYLEEKGK